MLKSSYQLGLEAEELVVRYFQKAGFKTIRRRWKTPYAEIDLVFQGLKKNQLLVLEVKRNAYAEFREWVLTKQQKNRLKRALIWLSEKGFDVDFRIVIVNKNDSIEIISDVFS